MARAGGKGYEVASLTDVASVKGPGTLRWTPLRKHFGITAFGLNAYTATEVGQDVVEEHTEERLGHEELYLVVAGRATFDSSSTPRCRRGPTRTTIWPC